MRILIGHNHYRQTGGEDSVLKDEIEMLRQAGDEVCIYERNNKEVDSLGLLNKGKVVSKVEIAEKIWEITFDTGTNVIEVYINFLRKKIDKDFSPKLIHTHIGLGYVIKEE